MDLVENRITSTTLRWNHQHELRKNQANNSEKPYMSKEDLYRREIAEMQKTNHTLMMRVKEQAEQIEKLEKKIDAKL